MPDEQKFFLPSRSLHSVILCSPRGHWRRLDIEYARWQPALDRLKVNRLVIIHERPIFLILFLN